MNIFAELVSSLGWSSTIIIAISALVTACIHGALGVAGGMLMAVILAYFIGVKPLLPVMSIAMLFSHAARAALNFRHIHLGAFSLISGPATPATIVVALIYSSISSPTIALILGTIVLLSLVFRAWARNRSIRPSKPVMVGVGTVYGALSGTAIGPGAMLPPLLLGYGLSRHQFVATIAVIALASNIIRGVVYQVEGLYAGEYVALGLLVGALTIPGNWLGRAILRRMTSRVHTSIVELFTFMAGGNFIFLAVHGYINAE